MLPVGVGSGAVVLSKGRVVGGINVTFPLGSESVMFVVAVTTRVEAVWDAVGGGVVSSDGTSGTSDVVVPVLTGSVRVKVEFIATELLREMLPERSSSLVGTDDVTLAGAVGVGVGADPETMVELMIGISIVDVKPVDRGTVSTKVVLILGVSTAVVRFDEGVANPLEPVEFEVAVAVERLKLPLRSTSLLVNGGPVEVELEGAGGIMPDPPVEVVKAVSDPVEKFPTPPVENPPVGIGADRVEFRVSVTTKVLAGGMTPPPPVLFAVAVAMMLVKLLTPPAVVMISVTTVGVTIPFPPVELNVAIEVAVETDPLPEIVVLLISTMSVSDETAVTTVGVSTPLAPVEVMVRMVLETTTIALVFGP